jgi:hypothetical protein
MEGKQMKLSNQESIQRNDIGEVSGGGNGGQG